MRPRTSGERARGLEEGPTETGDVTRQILAAYEAGDLITSCAWCGRVDIGGEWLLAPRAALTAIDSRLTLSHSICPSCVAVNPLPASRDPALP